MAPKKHTVESGRESAASILDAADAILAETGFDGMSIRDVAERAGVKKALVFYHFGNKAQLFERVLERYYSEHLEALQEALPDPDAGPEQLHGLIDAYFDYIASNSRYPRLIQQQVASGGATELIAKNLQPFFRWTEAALAAHLPADGPLAARHFYVSFSGMVINYFTYGPLLTDVWGEDPLSEAGIAERRAHVHWMADRVLEGLPREV